MALTWWRKKAQTRSKGSRREALRFRPQLTRLEDRLAPAGGVIVGNNVNVSRLIGDQNEATIAIDPTNTQRMFVASNGNAAGQVFTARSNNGGTTWIQGPTIGSCCDPSAAYDKFGNLYLVVLDQLLLSTNNGQTFTSILAISGGDQPTVATGPGPASNPGSASVWVTYFTGGIVAQGALVTGPGLANIGPFSPAQFAPGSTSNNFGDITVGPNGQVMVTYQDNIPTQGPSTIYVNLDPDGLGPMGFGARVTVTPTNVGGFDFIPPQAFRSVDAEAGLAYDHSAGPNRGRVYMVYTDETLPENDDLDIFVRYSDDNGASWSSPIRVNDDTTPNSQFLPRIAVDPSTGFIAVTFHDSRNDNGTAPGSTNGISNDDAQFFGAVSIDGGFTWGTNFQISNGTSNSARSPSPIDYGDYTGLAFLNGVFFPVWADNSNSTGDNPNGTLNALDVYTARIALINIPSIDVTTPNVVNEGQIFQFKGTFTDPGPSDNHRVEINWGDGSSNTVIELPANVFSFQTTHTYADDDPSGTPSDAYNITVNVFNSAGFVSSSNRLITVKNVAPTVFLPIEGPVDANVGQPFQFSVSFVDQSSADTHTVTWDFGDGTVFGPRPTTEPGALNPTHAYSAPGQYLVSVTIRDDDNGATTLQRQVNIVGRATAAVTLIDDPAHPGNQALLISGTNGPDRITVVPFGTTSSVVVAINGANFGPFAPDSRIIINASGGADTVKISPLVGFDAFINGGDGDDRVRGGSRNDVLIGGAGNDRLNGRLGRDIVIGGLGSDRLNGDFAISGKPGDDDILISDTTFWDTDDNALVAIHAEWTSSRSYSERVSRLAGGTDGLPRLEPATVAEEIGSVDSVFGGLGLDWFFADPLQDTIMDRGSQEQLN